MKTWEAVKALKEGKVITDGYYVITGGLTPIILSKNGDNLGRYDMNKFLEGDWKLYEEKPEIKKDPYVGKIAIEKLNNDVQGIITRNGSQYIVFIDHVTHYRCSSIETLLLNYYIEGEDF
jgi:hypothetical protein